MSRATGYALIALGVTAGVIGWGWTGFWAWEHRNDPNVDPATFALWALLTTVALIGGGVALVMRADEKPGNR